jgi:hypothetical protein
MNQNDKSEVRGPKSEVQGARCLGLSAGCENRQSQIANHPITQWPDDPRARGGCSPSRRCEIIPERAKTSHAKAPRRRGAKETKQLFFAIFASLRLGVKLSILSRLRSGRDAHATSDALRRGDLSFHFHDANPRVWGGECRKRANGVQSFPPQGPRGRVHRCQGGRGHYELGKPRGGN